LKELSQAHPSASVVILPVGSKVAKQVVKLGNQVLLAELGISARVSVNENTGVDSKSNEEAIRLFAATMRDSFLDGTYDLVESLSTHFYSVSRQRIESLQLLPVEASSLEAKQGGEVAIKPYIFEPSPEAIFHSIKPLLQLAVMQDLFTQNSASEQAARVMAMQSANDNAKKLLEQLQLEYNKLRQQSITNELLDIVGGQVR
ncbi:MAG: F0F1 ATP synthase subunit gamma, partial [Muribaculaceae bacterium]|nr:F0F1 ATP synthase subunit gamma [Muribaculaceae bacterium]